MHLQELLDYFETIAPLSLQEAYDNAGLIVGKLDQEIKGVITCLDSTAEVVQEAIDKGANVVVAHHPIIFSGLKSLTGANYIQRTIELAIKNDVAIVAMHTNLDNVMRNGVNQRIADQLGLVNQKILRLKQEDDADTGSGMIGDLPETMETAAFLAHLKAKMQVNCIKHTRIRHPKISRVAVAGGSGGFLLEDAKKAKADIFITSDYKYHEFFDANGEIIIADIGHYESEQFTIDLLCELINKNFSTFAAHCTEVNTNPVNYL